VRPALDDKCLASWNGLAIIALNRAGHSREAAHCLSAWLDAERKSSYLPHQIVAGQPAGNAFLDDYAALALACLQLGGHFTKDGQRLAGEMVARFYDEAAGGFFFTSADHEFLFGRSKPVFDSPIPSANALALECLSLMGDSRRLEQSLQAFAGWMARAPSSATALIHVAFKAQINVGVGMHLRRINSTMLRLVIHIPHGFHLNSNLPSELGLSPLTVELPGARIHYPEASAEGYSGELVIDIESDQPEPIVEVNYQACSSTECHAPQKMSLRL